jgi:hypothetical protein
MKDPFPNEDWLTDTPRWEPRQVVAPNRSQQRRAAFSERAQIADLRPPHLETVNFRGANAASRR